LRRQARKWYRKHQQIKMQNQRLKIKLMMQQKRGGNNTKSTSNLDILINATKNTWNNIRLGYNFVKFSTHILANFGNSVILKPHADIQYSARGHATPSVWGRCWVFSWQYLHCLLCHFDFLFLPFPPHYYPFCHIIYDFSRYTS